MNYLFSAKMTYCPSVTSKGADLTVKTFGEILKECGKPDIIRKVEAVRSEKDPEKRRNLKKRLPCFIPYGVCGDDTKEDSLKEPSGFISIDIDKKDNEGFEGFGSLKEYLSDRLSDLRFVAFCAHSVGGNGYYCLIPIENTDPSAANKYYSMLAEGFSKCGLNIDGNAKGAVRKRFVSYDPEPLINTGAASFDEAAGLSWDSPVEGAAAAVSSDEAAEPSDDPPVGGRAVSGDRLRLENEILPRIESERVDVTSGYRNWFGCLSAIKNLYADDPKKGEEIALRISSFYGGFDSAKTVRQYRSIPANRYPFSIGTILYCYREATGKLIGQPSAQEDFAFITDAEWSDIEREYKE